MSAHNVGSRATVIVLRAWLEYWAPLMGLPVPEIRVTALAHPNAAQVTCEWDTADLVDGPMIAVVLVDPRRFGRHHASDLALHELCHIRMRHHLGAGNPKHWHDEVRQCMRDYRRRRRDAKTRR